MKKVNNNRSKRDKIPLFKKTVIFRQFKRNVPKHVNKLIEI